MNDQITNILCPKIKEISEWTLKENDKFLASNKCTNPPIWETESKIRTLSQSLAATFQASSLPTDIFYDSLCKYSPSLNLAEQIEKIILVYLDYVSEIYFYEHPKPDLTTIMKRFSDRVIKAPKRITYLPIYNLDFSSGPQSLPFQMGKHIQICGIDSEVKSLMKIRLKETEEIFQIYDLPLACIKIEHDELMPLEAIRATREALLIILYGFFEVNAEIPISFTGYMSPWHPWKFESSTKLSSYINSPLPNLQIPGEEFDKALSYLAAQDNLKEILSYKLTHSRIIASMKREKWDIDNKIIDIAIAFENLLTGNQNISFRLSTIPPVILKNNLEERKELSDIIKEFYDYRSGITHANMDERKMKYFTGNAIDKYLGVIQHTIHQYLRLILLNPILKNKKMEKDLYLGFYPTLHISLTDYLKSLTK